MSTSNISHYFPFCRVKIDDFSVSENGKVTLVKLSPDRRYAPICSSCGNRAKSVHSYHTRIIRDLPMAESIMLLQLQYRKVRCYDCGICVERHDFVGPYARYTHRLAQYVFDLCEHMTVKDVSEFVHMSWDQIKSIDKSELVKRYKRMDFSKLNILCVDEISIRKRHTYLTIIANYETGQVLGVERNRDYYALAKFLEKLPLKVRQKIKAVAIDMWDPYIKAINEFLPDAKIVFDLFHVVAAFSRIIDKVRNEQYNKASESQKELMKRSRFLLLKNPQNLSYQEKPRLKQILKNNKTLANIYILKDYLKRLWQYRYRAWAEKFLNYWCLLAFEIKSECVDKFIKTLLRYKYGILNHCHYKIHTGKIEGINNKIKVAKKRAYGFRDLDYFGFKIMHITSN
jgi:transposase